VTAASAEGVVRIAGWFQALDQRPIVGLWVTRVFAAGLVVLAAACGAGSTTSEGKGSGAAASACSQLAALYRDALPAAAACTPGVSACTAQRKAVGAVLHAPRMAPLVSNCQRGSKARFVFGDQDWPAWKWEAREFGTGPRARAPSTSPGAAECGSGRRRRALANPAEVSCARVERDRGDGS
jgi:hypothetical protein